MARNADRWRMYAVTLPGFGGTPVPPLPTNTDAAVWHDHAVAATIRMIEQRDLRDVVLVGHSFGSAVALQVAAKLPGRVKALVNVDGALTSSRGWFPDPPADRPQAAQVLSATNTKRYGDADSWRVFNIPPPLTPERQLLYHGMFMATPRDVVFHYWRENLLRDLNPLLASLKIPVLDIKALSAADDAPERSRTRHLEIMKEAGAPPSVQTVFFYNTGHFVHELRPALLEEAILSFLAGHRVADVRPAPLPGPLPARFGHVERAGSGAAPLILMPCLGCDWRAFDEYMLRNAGKYRMYAVTWPGMGDTPLPRVTASGTPLVDNLVAAIARLIREEKLQQPILVGHSAAGPVAIRFAAEHPDLLGGVITVDAVIQNDTTLGFSQAQRDEWADAEFARVLRRLDSDEEWRTFNKATPGTTRSAARRQMYQDMWLTPPREHVFRYWREWLRLDAGRRLSSLSVPTLALFAIKPDDKTPAETRARILDQFRRNAAAGQVRVQFVEAAGHSIWETDPEKFDAAVDAFVNAARQPDGRPPNR